MKEINVWQLWEVRTFKWDGRGHFIGNGRFKGSKQWGIWNCVNKRFDKGISKPTSKEAWEAFENKAGKWSMAWRFKAREIPAYKDGALK